MRERTFPASWDAQQREGEVAVVVEEAVTGVRVVKGFGQEQRELDHLIARAQLLYGSRLRAVRLQARYQPVLQAIPVFGQVAVLALGGWMAIHHRITIGTFLAFSTYLLQLASPGPHAGRRCSSSASRPGPAPSGSSICWLRTRSSPNGPMPSRCRRAHGEVSVRRRALRLPAQPSRS